MSYFYFSACVCIWSASFLLMKKAVLVYEPLGVAAWRVLLGALVIMLAWWWRGRRWTLTSRQFFPLGGVVLLGFVWPFSIQPMLVGRVGSGVLGMSVGLVPLMTVLASIPLLRAFPTRLQVVGILGALAALAVLFMDRLRLDVSLADLGLLVTVPAGYACSNVIVRRWLTQIPTLELTSLSLVGASLCLTPQLTLPAGLSAAGMNVPSAITDSRDVAVQATMCLLLLGVVGTGLAQVFFNRMIQDRGPLFASMANNLVPVGAVILGWWDAETVTSPQIIALIAVVGMVILVQWEERRVRVG